MTKQKKLLNTLADYFIIKGKILSKREYKLQTDVPVRANVILRVITSWARLESLIAKNCPEKYARIIESDEEQVEEIPAKKSSLFSGLLVSKEGDNGEDKVNEE